MLALLLAGLLVGGSVAAQVSDLADRLPDALRGFAERFGVREVVPGGGGGDGGGPAAGDILGAVRGALGQVASFGTVLLDALSAVLLAVVGGVFLAGDPERYRAGVVALLPVAQRDRGRDLLDAWGTALERWLLATLFAMAVVGVLFGLGAWLIGVPSPLAVGLFAGIAQFVPVVGAVVGAVPLLLLALAGGGPTLFLWALALAVLIQQVESNAITPLVEERLVDIPPALLLFGIAAAGAVLGLPGVVLAGPITVLAAVAATKLYVRQTLGDRSAEVPGQGGGG